MTSNPLIKVDLTGLDDNLLEGIASRLNSPAMIHAKMAGTAESFLKKQGLKKSADEHRTADRLGAERTGHLEVEYNNIAATSTAAHASVWIPGSGRLRAAFGAYTVTPTGGRQYLTIPVAAEAYGKRAREIPGLIPMRVGPLKTPILALPDPEHDERITTYYLLVKSAHIPADESLISFDEMAELSALAAEKWLLGGDDGDTDTPN